MLPRSARHPHIQGHFCFACGFDQPDVWWVDVCHLNWTLEGKDHRTRCGDTGCLQFTRRNRFVKCLTNLQVDYMKLQIRKADLANLPTYPREEVVKFILTKTVDGG